MPSSRYPCRRCRTPIDTDYASCPFCEADDPLGYRRTQRTVLMLAVLLAGMLAAVWALGG